SSNELAVSQELRPSGLYRPNAEHPAPQTAGHPSGADACVWGPGAPRHPSADGLLVAPPHPWHRPPGTLVSEPAACSTSDRYSPLDRPDSFRPYELSLPSDSPSSLCGRGLGGKPVSPASTRYDLAARVVTRT